MRNSYEVFRNDSPKTNPGNNEGVGFTFIGIADCATVNGPVDARAIVGLQKNFTSVREFLAACEAQNYLAKESSATSADLSDEQKATLPAVPKKSNG